MVMMSSQFKLGARLAAAGALAAALFVSSTANAHEDPPGCFETGPAIVVSVFRADGTTGVVGSVSQCETINYQARLQKAQDLDTICAFSGGTFSLTTPDGVVHPISANVPCIGGTSGEGCDSTVDFIQSGLIQYTVKQADIVGGLITATAQYTGGVAHDSPANTAGVAATTPKSTPVITCADNNLCTTESCNPATGICANTGTTTCNDNNACTTESCNPSTGQCQTDSTTTCNDNNACTTESCNPSTGQCQTDSTTTCNDNNACTTESCNPSTGQCQTDSTTTCNDNNACTTESCNTSTGQCQTDSTTTCNDNNACTTESCNPSTGQCQTDSTTTCNDNNACTTESCNTSTGQCQTDSTKTCNDNNACTTESCNTSTGQCQTTNTVQCNDNDPCTDDSCNPSTGQCESVDNGSCNPSGCRVTGGGKVDACGPVPAGCDPSTGDCAPDCEFDALDATHGGQVGAPIGTPTAFTPDSACIQGEWTHVRHIRPGLFGNFHASTFDSLMCACLPCAENPDSPGVIGALCNPGDRICGPEPRRAPDNKICFSGVGNYALSKGKRTEDLVVFRVDIE